MAFSVYQVKTWRMSRMSSSMALDGSACLWQCFLYCFSVKRNDGILKNPYSGSWNLDSVILLIKVNTCSHIGNSSTVQLSKAPCRWTCQSCIYGKYLLCHFNCNYLAVWPELSKSPDVFKSSECPSSIGDTLCLVTGSVCLWKLRACILP